MATTYHIYLKIIFLLCVLAIIIIIASNANPPCAKSPFVKSPFANTDTDTGQLPDTDVHFIFDSDIGNILNSVSNFKISQSNSPTMFINTFHHKTMKIGQFTYRPLGQICTMDTNEMTDDDKLSLIKNSKSLHYMTSSPIIPKKWTCEWTSNDKNDQEQSLAIWHPIAQYKTGTMSDYIILGKPGDKPADDALPCLPINILIQSPLLDRASKIIWNSNGIPGNIVCWMATNMGFFRSSISYGTTIAEMPELDRVYNITQSALELNTIQS